MACIVKVGNKFENLSGYNTFIKDKEPNSFYFRVSKFADTFTAGKNLFLMEGSEFLKESTELKIEIVDAEGNTLYVEPGRGVPDYYEGNSVVLSTHVYETTPVGPAKITILGELKEYVDDDGILRPIPAEWEGAYNVKWEKNFYLNKNEKNSAPVIFYKKPQIVIDEVESTIVEQSIPEITQSGSIVGRAENPPEGTDLNTWRAGTLYRLERQGGDGFKSSMDENIISIPSLGYEGVVKEVINNNVVLVDKPLVDSSNKIINFLTASDYSITFSDFGSRTSNTSAVTASYGKIRLKNLDTFTGNVDKLKIFKKSRSDVGDFKFQDEIKIVAGNLLRDPLVPGSELDGGFGKLTETNVDNYWTTQSVSISGSDTSISYDNDTLYESIKINVPSSSFQTASVELITNNVFDLYDDVDYELNFKTLVSGSYRDVISGPITVVSESYARTYYYKFDSSKLTLNNPTYLSQSSETEITSPNSQSVDLTKPLVYDNSRVVFNSTPLNDRGNVYSSIPLLYAYTHSHDTTLTFDTTSVDWGTNSRIKTVSSDKANIVARSGSFCGEFNLVVWLDSGSFTLPTGGSPADVRTYIETFDSASVRIALLSFQNIDTDAKFYYKHSSTELGELESFRTATEYQLENIDTNDYNNSSIVSTWNTGSQAIIDYYDSGYHYVHIDYRTLRNIEPLNAELINVKRLDSLDGDILYGITYEINSINFETGDIVFSHNATDGTLSGVLSLVNGQAVLTIGSNTTTGYIVELDFNQSIMVFVGELDFTELTPAQRSYDLYDLFDLSGSSWISTGSTELYVPRVPPQGGDYLYSSEGYPYRSTEFSDRNFLTTEFTSPSSSNSDFSNPLEIPYIFRNDNDRIENVYVEDGDQIYVVSSVSSSVDINNTNYIYDQGIVYSGYFFTGSYSGSLYVDSSLSGDTYQVSLPTYNTNITALNPISSSFGQLNFVLLTDSGSTTLPTNTGSLQFHYEEFQSGSTIRTAIALRNVETDAKFYYNNSSVSQSVLQSYSGSTNVGLDSIDSGDFTNTELWFLSTGSQAILDFGTGSNSHFFYIDYRTNRNSEPLNADLQEVTAISQIGSTDFSSLLAREIFPLSGSTTITGSVTSTNYYTSQLPLVAGNYLYNIADYPFIASTITDGTYITDDADPNTDVTIPDTRFNIPYVFNTVDGKVENVFVKRLDSIYTASSINGTGTTQYTEPAVFVSQSLKGDDTIVPKTLTAFITGSYPSGGLDYPFYETLTTLTADATFATRKQIQHLFTMPFSGSGKLGFSVRGDGWQISNVDLKPSQDSSFSPRVFDVFDEQDRNLPVETFDYRFELYDVNNNYIPVELKASKTFSGGNKVSTDTIKILTFETDKSTFRFASGSLANPPFQQVRFNFSKTTALSGSITFESAAFDKDGVYIDPLSYSGDYPGGLTNVTSTNALLTIANFSGSDSSYEVSSIVYTASVQDNVEYETIIRLEDGEPYADLIVNNNRSIVTFKQSTGLANPTDQVSRITVKRKNLGSNTEVITANSASLVGNAPPLTLLSDDSTTGIATYFVSGSSLNLQSGSVTYEFSASDEFGQPVSDFTTVTPISFLGGVVLYLSNERGILPAYYTGIIPSSSYVYTSGSTKLYIEGEEVTYSNSGGTNTYKITGVTGSGITPNEVAPTTNNYGGIPGTMTTESSSLEINVRYTDASNVTYDFGRTANYNIVREGEQGQPGLSGSNGPGLVFTGPYTESRDYVVNLSGALTRADAVLFNSSYYLALQDNGPGTSAGLQHPSSSTEYWENLGSGSRFVAAELAIFEESFVQNTINVGTNNSGSTSAANITIAGGTNYPWISIGQSGQTGTQGYNVGNGIFLGINGNSGTASLSLESPILGGNELLWDGNTLRLKGDLNLTNNDFISSSGEFTLGSGSLQFDGELLTISASMQFENVPDLIAEYSNSLSGSAASAQQTANTNLDYLQDLINGNQILNGGTFINGGIVSSPILAGGNGYISESFRVGNNGITLDGANKKIYVGTGTFTSSDTPFYVDNDSNFSLGDKLSWNGSTLNVSGTIIANALSIIPPETLPVGIVSGSSQIVESLPDGLISGSEQLPVGIISGSEQLPAGLVSASAFSFGPQGLFNLASITSPINSGLFLSNTHMGFYQSASVASGGSNWKSYMDNSGNFYLGGTEGAMAWNGSSLQISGSINSIDGTIAGFTLRGNNIESLDETLVMTGGSSPEIKFINADTASVIINNSTTLTPTTVISAPTFSGTITGTTSNQLYDYIVNSSDTSLNISYATETVSSNSVSSATISSELDGVSATITAILSPGNSSDGHIKSFLDMVAGTGAYQSVSAKIHAILYKDGSQVDKKSFDISAFTINISGDSTLTVSSTKTAVFNIVLDGGSVYSIKTSISNVNTYAQVYPNAAEPSESLTIDFYTPKINSSPVIKVNVGEGNKFTEISRGGFQVVSSADKKIIIPTNTGLGDPALVVSGSIEATGNITAYSTSDLRLKQNIKLIPDALDKIKEISGVTFDWKEGFTDIHNFQGSDIGVIAQEVEYVLPHIVKQNKQNGYRGVRYEKLTPLLIEAIKELSKKVDSLEKEIKQLKG